MNNLVTTTHFAIKKDEWDSKQISSPRLSLKQIMPHYSTFETMMTQVGKPWKWNKRSDHVGRLNYWRNVLRDPRTSLFALCLDGHEIGLCMTMYPRENRHILLTGNNPVEIKYFGLHLEHTGKGYGGHFLAMIFDKLFKFHDEVYLSTRSTNHKKVVPFYMSMGMKILKQEQKPNDVLNITDKTEYKKVS